MHPSPTYLAPSPRHHPVQFTITWISQQPCCIATGVIFLKFKLTRSLSCLEFFMGFPVFLGQRPAFSEKHCVILGPILLPSFFPGAEIELARWVQSALLGDFRTGFLNLSTAGIGAGLFFLSRHCSVCSSMLTDLPRLCR